MRSIEWRNLPPGPPNDTRRTDHQPEGAPLPILVEQWLARPRARRAEPVQAAEVVHAVHTENPTAIVLWRFELSVGAMRVKSATNR